MREKWCKRFDDCFKTQAQKTGFRDYLGGLLGESERKNLTQMADNAVGVVDNRLHHFLTDAPWNALEINERRLQVMNKCSQTRISRGFALILDDSGHRKSGNLTDGVGRQYLGEIGKTDNGIVLVTTHLYDGKKSLPLDLELDQHATSLPQGKKDEKFQKKPDIGIGLIDRTLDRGCRPGIVLIDAGYGNNTTFLHQLEDRKLKYLGGVAKNRKVLIKNELGIEKEIRLDQLAQSLSTENWEPVHLCWGQPKIVWVAIFNAKISRLKGERTFAIVMNARSFSETTDIDYFITNVDSSQVTAQWVVTTYSGRNWVEVFYREAKGWLGLREYQVRDKRSLIRHLIWVFCAYTFILWHKLTGGLRRRRCSSTFKYFY